MSVPARFLLLLSISLAAFLAQPSAPALADEPGSQCWAVFTGVSDYKLLDDLSFSDDSAHRLYDLFSPIWGEGHTRLLLDSEATKAGIQSAIDWVADKDSASDTVLIYFTGHGDSRGYIAPYDAYYEPTWISSQEFAVWLNKLHSEKVVVIMDACYSGQFEAELSGSGRVVIMSSRAGERSWQTNVLGQGDNVFSYWLFQALKDFSNADANEDHEL